MQVYVHFNAFLLPAVCLSRREISSIIRNMLNALELQDLGVGVIFVHDFRMQELNRKFLHCNGPTNVLAFPESPETDAGFLGEIFISVQALKRESLLYGQPVLDHLLLLLGHGLLHLTGQDHGPEMDHLVDQLQNSITAKEYCLGS